MEVSKNGTTWYRNIVALAPWLAGIVAFIGGCLAHLEGTAEIEGKQEFIHGIVAFALVPEGMATLSLPILAATLCGGGLVFCILDAAISRTGGSKAQFMAMLFDFVSEAMALGALFGHSHKTGCTMSFAGGSILYLVFQDIAPQSKMQRHWSPTLGAVPGFVVGMIGKQVVG